MRHRVEHEGKHQAREYNSQPVRWSPSNSE
jgi:hypothetical protein